MGLSIKNKKLGSLSLGLRPSWKGGDSLPGDLTSADLYAWYNSGTGIWVDSGKNTAASDDQTIYWWDDASGNGQHISQVASSLRPLYKTGIIGSLDVGRFDGAGDYMVGGGLGDKIRAGRNMIVTYIVDVVDGRKASFQTLHSVLTDNDNRHQSYIDTGSSGDLVFRMSINGILIDAVASANLADGPTGPTICSFFWNGSTRDMKVFRDGAEVASNIHTKDPNQFVGNGDISMMGRPDGNSTTEGDMGEMIIYDGDDASRQDVEAYLESKSGLSIL